MKSVYLNGRIVAQNEATISMFDRGYLFSDDIDDVTAAVASNVQPARTRQRRESLFCGPSTHRPKQCSDRWCLGRNMKSVRAMSAVSRSGPTEPHTQCPPHVSKWTRSRNTRAELIASAFRVKSGRALPALRRAGCNPD